MMAPLNYQYDGLIADFWTKAWQATFPDIDFEARRPWILQHLADMRSSDQIVRAFFDAALPVGFYSLYPATGLIEQVCVSLNAKGRGLGKLLIADAKTQTHETLNLVVNADNLAARKFYAKLGFLETSHGLNAESTRSVIKLQMSAERNSTPRERPFGLFPLPPTV